MQLRPDEYMYPVSGQIPHLLRRGDRSRPSVAVPLTYAGAGVDSKAVGRALGGLLRAARAPAVRGYGRPLLGPGHFSGLLQVGEERLALTTDNVGTKVLLAEQLGSWEGVGEDLVGVNVNDLSAVGARPLALLDYLMLPRPDPKLLATIGKGIGRGLRQAKCALVGGETAIVPDLVRTPDLSGTALGYFPPGRSPLTGRSIRVGDVLVGIPSSGVHANGFTLVRRLLERARTPLDRPLPGERIPFGKALLRPTRIYTSAAEALLDRHLAQGLAHITGGGVRNLSRLHPSVEFTLESWPGARGVFEWIVATSRLPPKELFQTFNMGIGFVATVRRKDLPAALGALAEAGARDARVIGRVSPGRGVRLPSLGIRYEGY